MSNQQTALRSFRAWDSLDLEGLLVCLSEDIVFENIPMGPVFGKENLQNMLAPLFMALASCAWEVLNIAETADGSVLSERRDVMTLKNGQTVTLSVMGTLDFDVAGKISHWRDYFDLSEFNAQMGLPADTGRRLASS
ncbi:limonene-1,2-epoxide hydrolase family protein [Sphingobium indicum]|uniref:limonene-1,2-epoxide hydrolase family protein n=1 Tax=Sphingobium indicum TaxID=332055 RepID=UPI0006844050|nr:nuclear transport factor 2 family protein [Sphingobium indicum]